MLGQASRIPRGAFAFPANVDAHASVTPGSDLMAPDRPEGRHRLRQRQTRQPALFRSSKLRPSATSCSSSGAGCQKKPSSAA